jgi:Tol biopolymer transport system component
VKRPSYLELGRRIAFGRPLKKPLGPVPPPPDPSEIADFDLGTWRVRPGLKRMTRADRIVALDQQTLLTLLVLAERPAGGTNRDELAARVFGGGLAEDHEPKLRRVLGLLRRVFSEDGAVRIANAPRDCYVLEVGEPVPGRGLKGTDAQVLRDDPGAVQAWMTRSRHRLVAFTLAALVVIGLAAGLIALVNSGHVVLFGVLTGVKPLATEPGAKTSPSFSPDGRQIVYSWQLADAGGTHLVTRSVGGGSWRPLTGGAGTDLYPAWSPAGNLIAFERITDNECAVLVVAPDSSGEKRVGDCNFGAAGPVTWTRDGHALIFAHRTDALLSRQLVSLALDSGKLSGVTNPVVGMPGDEQPVLAPNGRRLVFVRTRSVGVADLSLLDLGTVAVERVTKDRRELAGAAFEAGSLSVVFASPRGGRMALWRTRMNGRAPEPLLASVNELRHPAIANDGRALAYEEWQYTTRLERLSAAAAGVAVLRPAAGVRERQMQPSPDGSQLAFVSTAGGGEEVWLAPFAGGPARALTQLGLDGIEFLHWSPDGKLIVFDGASKGRFNLWSVRPADGAVEQLSSDGASRAPSFAHDGRWLYFASARGGSWQIWREPWPAAGSGEALTTEGGIAALESPDGNALYYVRGDRPGLWLRNTTPDGDDSLVVGAFSPADWSNWAVAEDAVWIVLRPDVGPPMLARYSTSSHLVTPLQPLPALLPDSGLALSPDRASAIVATIANARADLKLASFE